MDKLLAASPVNAIDSIVITEETNISNVFAQWIAFDPDITVHGDLTAAKAVKLFIKWSDKNGTIDLQPGDYFTFVIPDIFMYELVNNVTDAALKNDDGDTVATYSIYDNEIINKKELKVTFTDYADTHTNISGELWLLLFVGEVDTTEHKILEFIINGNLEADGEVTVNPHDPYTRKPHNEKNGYSYPPRMFNGYYIFEWLVFFNMNKNPDNGFNTLEDFSFDDIIPADSPHAFLTDQIKRELGPLLSAACATQIGEYTGADSYPPQGRYPIFEYHYNSTGDDIWYAKIKWYPLANGLATAGIDGGGGLNVSDVEVADKLFSAKLGTVTRPTAIRYYTIATVKLAKNALGDKEVVRLFNNTFKASTGEDLPGSLQVYRFESGGGAQGISGDYSFAFTKVNTEGSALPGAMFSLYISEDFTVGADRIVYSGGDGVVSFRNLPAGTFYVQETTVPTGYILDSTIYKVVLSSTGFEIYYGDNYEKKLSDQDNKIVNRLDVQPVTVTLQGTKRLTGRTLSGGMFNFVVRGKDGAVAATGSNDANGGINCSEIEFDSPGVYTFTVEEVRGTYSGITYDESRFTVTVTVTNGGSGKLTAEVAYPDEGVVFNNSYIAKPVPVTLQGAKRLTGRTLSGGMFNFIVRNKDGAVAATGSNDENGSINCGEIVFSSPGVYIFTVEEVRGGYSGITYDESKFTITVTVEDDGDGNLTAEISYPPGGVVFNNSYAETPVNPCKCYARAKVCRKSIEGKKVWIDDNNEGNTRPRSVEIVLIRDGEVYKRITVDSAGDGSFAFYCLPICKNSLHEYSYQIDEPAVPDGYTKTIEGYNVVNTLNP